MLDTAAKPKKGILKKKPGAEVGPDIKRQRKAKKGKKGFKTTTQQIQKHLKEKHISEKVTEDAVKKSDEAAKNMLGKKAVKRKLPAKKDKGPDGAKKMKFEEMTKKERKIARRKTKTNYDLTIKSKKIWEQVRDKNCHKDVREKLLTELCELIKGKVPQLVYAHDTVRVLECCVQYGTEDQRKDIFNEINEKAVELCKSKFGKFYIIKMLRYGSKEQKSQIIRSFYGNVRQLVSNKVSAEVLEEAYNNYANAQERSALMEEFYGPTFAVFKEGKTQSLSDILKSNPEKKPTIMEHLQKQLMQLTEKSVIKHSIVHKALLDYMTHSTEKNKVDLVANLREGVVEILHTPDGSKVAMQCLWFGSAKDRKIIIKSMKPFINKICKEEHGFKVLLALLDCVDDTKLVKKAIIEEILKDAYEYSGNVTARKVLLYMLRPRHPSFFHPDVVKQLELGDTNPSSKKNPEIRRKEILEAVSAPLITLASEHVKEMVFDRSKSQLFLAIVEFALGNKENIYRSVAELVAEYFVPVDPSKQGKKAEMHMVEDPSGHLVLKRMLHFEKESEDTAPKFSDIVMEMVPEVNFGTWIKVNRGLLVMISLLECGSEETQKKLRTMLSKQKHNLEQSEAKSAAVLLEKLQR